MTVIISLYYYETNQIVFFEKSSIENLKLIKNILPNVSGNPKIEKQESNFQPGSALLTKTISVLMIES